MINRIGAAPILVLALCAVSAAQAQESARPGPTAQRSEQLDLRIPHITELYTHEQIQALLAPTFLETREYAEEVEVQGRREAVTPTVWRGIAAPFWAIFNPTQAWRIIAPFPPDQSRALAFNADVTTPYQRPAARTAADP
jgi:hypothetical protein